jgi:hypothetical protein
LEEALERMRLEIETTRDLGQYNTDAYLTSDYIDVYVATSMRYRWDFEEAYDFMKNVFGSGKLKELKGKLRYFDPTQSYSINRIDKGLIEGLMLRRASCTVYLAQESETFGKDSECAATLAQGKPVIVYIPEYADVGERKEAIKRYPIMYILQRLVMLSETHDFRDCVPHCEDIINKLTVHYKNKFIDTVDFGMDEEFKSKYEDDIDTLCSAIAELEGAFFDRREEQFKEIHPLGIQVDLKTGVANGVLVVRNPENCAELVYNLLTSQTEYEIKFSEDMLTLAEKTSDSAFRVVTANEKLTNSFWDFY